MSWSEYTNHIVADIGFIGVYLGFLVSLGYTMLNFIEGRPVWGAAGLFLCWCWLEKLIRYI